MKTEEQLVTMALRIAKEDGNARVVFALPSLPETRHFFSLAKRVWPDSGGVARASGLLVDFPSGGRVEFRTITEENHAEWGGVQCGYIFAPHQLKAITQAWIKSRMRCSKPLKVPMGYYTPYWVERNISYKDLE